MPFIVVSFMILFAVIGCTDDYRYLTAKELAGLRLESHKNVYKVAIKVQAQATCSSELKLFLMKNPRIVPVKGSIDTVLTQDWYSEPMNFRLEYDSCIVNHPLIGIKFIDGTPF